MPVHQPQLTGVSSQSADCGVRTTQMLIDWATRGAKKPGPRWLRKRMGFDDPTAPIGTNPSHWDRAIKSFDSPAELGGKYEFIPGTPLLGQPWSRIENHLIDGKMVGLAIHYGTWDRLAPKKSGSSTFKGFHAVPLKGLDDRGRTKDFDPLFDGRRADIPRGPIMVPLEKMEQAAKALSKMATGRNDNIYGYLAERAVSLGGGVVVPDPEEPVTLGSLRADLVELLDSAASDAQRRLFLSLIDDLDEIVGPYMGEADPDDDPEEGVANI